MTDERARTPRQFPLRSLILVVALAGVAFGVLANSREHHVIVYRTTALPPDDRAMEAWYRKQPRLELRGIRRESGNVRVEYRRRGVLPSFQPVTMPNLSAAGYGNLSSMAMSVSRPSPFGIVDDWVRDPSPALAWVGVSMAIAFVVVVVRRIWDRRQGGVSPRSESSG